MEARRVSFRLCVHSVHSANSVASEHQKHPLWPMIRAQPPTMACVKTVGTIPFLQTSTSRLIPQLSITFAPTVLTNRTVVRARATTHPWTHSSSRASPTCRCHCRLHRRHLHRHRLHHDHPRSTAVAMICATRILHFLSTHTTTLSTSSSALELTIS
jgi:hypothetical protein